jgi:hypothetical protein
MKTIIIGITALFVGNTVCAQFKIPTKKDVEKGVAKEVKNIGKGDGNNSSGTKPEIDTTSKPVTPIPTSGSSSPGGNKNGYSRDGAVATSKQMTNLFTEPFLFEKGTLNVSGDKGDNKPAILEAIETSDGVIKEFEQKVDEFIKSKPAPSVLKSQYHYVVSKANGLEGAIKNADDGFKNWRSMSAVSFLQDLHLYKAYIAGAIKVYPEAISLQEKLEQADEAIKKIGSREDYMTKMEKNQLDYVKSLRMKPAQFRDAAIEKMVKTKYENWASQDKVTVLQVNITSDWTIEKNVLDIPIEKSVQVNMAVKKADGTCGFATGTVRQAYEGGGKYSAPGLTMPSPVIVVPCENLPK